MFRTWQSVLQPCCGNKFDLFKTWQLLRSCAVRISSICLELCSLLCSRAGKYVWFVYNLEGCSAAVLHEDLFRIWHAAPELCSWNDSSCLELGRLLRCRASWIILIRLELDSLLCSCAAEVCDFLKTWQAAPNPCCQNKFDFFYNFAGCSRAVIGNKIALFITGQVAMQLCLGMGLIWLEFDRYPHSNAAIISFIRLQFGSLLCWNNFRTCKTALWLCWRNKCDFSAAVLE